RRYTRKTRPAKCRTERSAGTCESALLRLPSPGSVRVTGAGESVPAFADFSARLIMRKIVSARRRNQHARRVRYPELLTREHPPQLLHIGDRRLAGKIFTNVSCRFSPHHRHCADRLVSLAKITLALYAICQKQNLVRQKMPMHFCQQRLCFRQIGTACNHDLLRRIFQKSASIWRCNARANFSQRGSNEAS